MVKKLGAQPRFSLLLTQILGAQMRTLRIRFSRPCYILIWWNSEIEINWKVRVLFCPSGGPQPWKPRGWFWKVLLKNILYWKYIFLPINTRALVVSLIWWVQKKIVVRKWWTGERDILFVSHIFTLNLWDKVSKISEKVLIKTKMAENWQVHAPIAQNWRV